MNIDKINNRRVIGLKAGLTTRNMVMIGVLGAVSTILMLLEFPVPLSPTFVKMDFSELPIIIGAFMMGPFAGICIIVIKIALNFILNGTTTMGVGELANMIGSISYVLPAVLIYRLRPTRKQMMISLIAGTLVVSGVTLISNLYLIFPVYVKLYGMNMDMIVTMGRATNPYVTNMFSLMLFSMLPFNLIKYGVVSVVTFLVNKRLGRVLSIDWNGSGSKCNSRK